MQLHPHPSMPIGPVNRIDVTTARSGNVLELVYRLHSGVSALLIPQAEPSARTDELWRHTCFEVFVMAGEGYYEFNLSPSTQWAAYRFTAYREGMCDAAIVAPEIAWRASGDGADLRATLHLPDDAAGPLGLSAVIEANDCAKSYWALAHPPGKPDFHAAACFVGKLPSAV